MSKRLVQFAKCGIYYKGTELDLSKYSPKDEELREKCTLLLQDEAITEETRLELE